MRSVRSPVSCQSQGPTTSTSAPATAPGTMNAFVEPPLCPRKITAPAIRRATPRRGSEPPGRREPPREATVARPARRSVTPITDVSDSPSATRSAAVAAAIRTIAGQAWRPPSYTQSARYSRMPAPPASVSSAKTSRTSVGSTPRRAPTPPQTPARTRSRPLRSKSSVDIASSYGAFDVDLACADRGVDDEVALVGGAVARVLARDALPAGVDRSDLRVCVDGRARGQDEPELADPELRP